MLRDHAPARDFLLVRSLEHLDARLPDIVDLLGLLSQSIHASSEFLDRVLVDLHALMGKQ